MLGKKPPKTKQYILQTYKESNSVTSAVCPLSIGSCVSTPPFKGFSLKKSYRGIRSFPWLVNDFYAIALADNSWV